MRQPKKFTPHPFTYHQEIEVEIASLSNLGVIHDDDLQLRIKYDGTVEWEPLVLFTTHCDVSFAPTRVRDCVLHVYTVHVLYFSLTSLGVIHDDELQLRIKYDGTVEWQPLILFTTHCSVSLHGIMPVLI